MTARVPQKPKPAQLLQAVRQNAVVSVQILLERGADFNIRDENDRPVLMMAARLGYADIVGLLVKAGAKPDEKGPNGSVSIIEATYRGYIDVVRVLLDNGADVNATERDNTSALHCSALHKERFGIMRLLIERGARLDIMTEVGDTAMSIANGRGHMELVKLLQDAPDIRDAYLVESAAAATAIPEVPNLSQLASTASQQLLLAHVQTYVIKRRMQP